MKRVEKYLLFILVIGIPAFLLGPVIWTRSTDLVPLAWQLPFFILISVVEAALFGFGICWMVENKKLFGINPLLYIAVSWLMVSWWPHDNLHMHNGL